MASKQSSFIIKIAPIISPILFSVIFFSKLQTNNGNQGNKKVF